MSKLSGKESAFTLVEMVIALAVVSFCLVTLFGLLATGLMSSHKSTVDTNVAAVTWDSANQIRTNSFPGANAGSFAGCTNWYDADGLFISHASTAPANAYYECDAYAGFSGLVGMPASLQISTNVISYPVAMANRTYSTNYVLISPTY